MISERRFRCRNIKAERHFRFRKSFNAQDGEPFANPRKYVHNTAVPVAHNLSKRNVSYDPSGSGGADGR